MLTNKLLDFSTEGNFMNIRAYILLLLTLPSITVAETYKNIGPLDSLGDVKEKFPNAKYEIINAGWITQSDALYKITGEGMSGTIVVKFDDSRPGFKNYAQENPESEYIDTYNTLATQTDESALTVNWVRWVPDTLIPLQRFILKYGQPEKSGFSDEDMQPYKSWESKGLTAYLTDNGTHVLRIDYSFTKDEYRSAWKLKYNFIPAWLQNPSEKNPKKPSKAVKKI